MIKAEKDDYLDLINNFYKFCEFLHLDKPIEIDLSALNDFIYDLSNTEWNYDKFQPEYLNEISEKNPLLFSLVYAYSKYLR